MVPYIHEKNISRKITTNYIQTSEIVGKWESVIDVLKSKHVTDIREITPVMAEKYQFDLHGLFRELNVPESHIYPHMRVNGYNCSNEYYGELLSIKMIDQYAVEQYLELFIRN